jgi:hypothetical protein
MTALNCPERQGAAAFLTEFGIAGSFDLTLHPLRVNHSFPEFKRFDTRNEIAIRGLDCTSGLQFAGRR